MDRALYLRAYNDLRERRRFVAGIEELIRRELQEEVQDSKLVSTDIHHVLKARQVNVQLPSSNDLPAIPPIPAVPPSLPRVPPTATVSSPSVTLSAPTGLSTVPTTTVPAQPTSTPAPPTNADQPPQQDAQAVMNHLVATASSIASSAAAVATSGASKNGGDHAQEIHPHGLSPAAIAGIVGCCVLLVLLVIAAIVALRKGDGHDEEKNQGASSFPPPAIVSPGQMSQPEMTEVPLGEPAPSYRASYIHDDNPFVNPHDQHYNHSGYANHSVPPQLADPFRDPIHLQVPPTPGLSRGVQLVDPGFLPRPDPNAEQHQHQQPEHHEHREEPRSPASAASSKSSAPGSPKSADYGHHGGLRVVNE
ncbi:hypothetical protein K474DRAFT_150442 [Panus rudis PR-1116 ss-1]|nr:hypothetical protein K474DRAFT_150442 [Panus rudis PR-1116 ss-1]